MPRIVEVVQACQQTHFMIDFHRQAPSTTGVTYPEHSTSVKEHKPKNTHSTCSIDPIIRGFCKKNMCDYIKITPHCRLAIECLEIQEKRRQRNKLTWSSFKQIRIEKYIIPLASCYSQQNLGIFDPPRGYTPQEVPSKQQNVLHSHMCTSCASNFRRKGNFF